MLADARRPAPLFRCTDSTKLHEKVTYYSREMARHAARRQGMRDYRCPKCGWFHLSTSPAA